MTRKYLDIDFFKFSKNSFVFLTIVVFFTSTIGIILNQQNLPMQIWPANAIILALLLRRPDLNSVYCWGAIFIGFTVSHIGLGSNIAFSALIALASLAGIATGRICFSVVSPTDIAVKRPESILYIFLVSVFSAFISATIGASVVSGTFDTSFTTNFINWLSAEVFSFTIFLPLLLTLPINYQDLKRLNFQSELSFSELLPIILLMISFGICIVTGGYETIPFLIPALIWCTLTYSIFVMSLVMMLIAVSFVIAGVNFEGQSHTLNLWLNNGSGFRLALALLCLMPLSMSALISNRKVIASTTNILNNQDAETGMLSRKGFYAAAQFILRMSNRNKSTMMFSLVEIDNINRILEENGTPLIREMAVKVAHILETYAPEKSAVGRFGHGKFAIITYDVSQQECGLAMQDICDRINELIFEKDIRSKFKITSSSGYVWIPRPQIEETSLAIMNMEHRVEAELRIAKSLGGNRVSTASF